VNGLLAAATGTAPVQAGTWDRLLADLDGGDLATVAAALVGAFAAVAAAVIAAGVAVRATGPSRPRSAASRRRPRRSSATDPTTTRC
jgi:hypothetical protein